MNYSVPYEYIKHRVDVRLTHNVVEVFFNHHRICSHPRLHGHPGQYSTKEAHMPQNHKTYIAWDAACFESWAMKKMLKGTDEWLRRRLRMYIWKRWKRVRTRYTMLRNLGHNHNTAFKFACTRKGYWRIAKSPILNTTLTDTRLQQAGYTFFLEHFKTVWV